MSWSSTLWMAADSITTASLPQSSQWVFWGTMKYPTCTPRANDWLAAPRHVTCTTVQFLTVFLSKMGWAASRRPAIARNLSSTEWSTNLRWSNREVITMQVGPARLASCSRSDSLRRRRRSRPKSEHVRTWSHTIRWCALASEASSPGHAGIWPAPVARPKGRPAHSLGRRRYTGVNPARLRAGNRIWLLGGMSFDDATAFVQPTMLKTPRLSMLRKFAAAVGCSEKSLF